MARGKPAAEPSVVFLRGVNVGPSTKVPMKELAAKLSGEVGDPVANYLQSGNLIVSSGDAATLGKLVSGLIDTLYGLTVPAVVRSATELRALLAANPWPGDDPKQVHLTMWEESHDEAAADAFAALDWQGDEIAFSGSNAWLRFTRPSHTSKLDVQALDKRLGVKATARNLRTITKVAELAAGTEP